MRRILVSFVGVSLIAGSAGMAWGDAPVSPDVSSPVQMVAGGRIIQPRAPTARPMVRRYRSYSIDPGTAGVVEGTSSGAVTSAPRAVSPGRSTKPSYMRADSKARGRYHQ